MSLFPEFGDDTTFIMKPHKGSRVATTPELIELNRAAIRFGASRVLDEYALLNLDPSGLHVLTHIYFFWHPFRRCEIQLKVSGTPYPSQAILDLQDEWFDQLITLGDYIKALNYWKKNPRRVDATT